jgi:hypothetical protein
MPRTRGYSTPAKEGAPDQTLAGVLGRVGGRVKEVAKETFKKPLGPDKETINLMQEMGWYQKSGDSGWHDMIAGINQSFIEPALKAGDLMVRGSRLVVQATSATIAETAKEVFGMSQGDARRLERDLVIMANSAAMVTESMPQAAAPAKAAAEVTDGR